MTEMLQVNQVLPTAEDQHLEFKLDVASGLSQVKKQIKSQYFYDEHGSELFNKITRHPDYYLTQCEIEILNQYKSHIAKTLGDQPFNLIELGPGEGIKTELLLKQFLVHSLNFTYLPIDISKKFLHLLIQQFDKNLPTIELKALHADYFSGLDWVRTHSVRRNLVLFLGSSIGNFDLVAAGKFLQALWDALNEGDYVLLGFDLRKNIDILLRAYNDSSGITRDFNLNLLTRMNRELQANFMLKQFQHYATYNVYTGTMESYLVSLTRQRVNIGALRKDYEFEAMEPVHVEYSHKYSIAQIEQLAHAARFKVVQHFMDKRNFFVDTLWQVNKRNV